jgi:hypothetical protein
MQRISFVHVGIFAIMHICIVIIDLELSFSHVF